MIIVTISSTEKKLIVRLKHKIDYVVEKKIGSIKSLNKRTLYAFAILFLSIPKMIYKEMLMMMH